MANRVWAHLIGRGIVEPVDDFRATNPPSNPALLGRPRRRIRPGRIPGQAAHSPDHEFGDLSVAAPSRRLAPRPRGRSGAILHIGRGEDTDGRADPRCDLVGDGNPERFPGYPSGTRAIEIAEGEIPNQFLRAFTKPVRNDACDCARKSEPSLNEVIQLVNNADILAKIESPENRLARGYEGGKAHHGTGRACLPGDPQPASHREGVGDRIDAHRQERRIGWPDCETCSTP